MGPLGAIVLVPISKKSPFGVITLKNTSWYGATFWPLPRKLETSELGLLAVIEIAFFNTKLQGPAPKKEEIVIPLVSTHYSNFDSKSISITANSLLKETRNSYICVTPKNLVLQKSASVSLK